MGKAEISSHVLLVFLESWLQAMKYTKKHMDNEDNVEDEELEDELL